MKLKHVIVAAAFVFMAGCETTGNTTGSASASSTNNTGAGTASGTSTSGNTNPASASANARGSLTDAATVGTGTANGAIPPTNNGNMNTQSGTTPPATSANNSTMNGTPVMVADVTTQANNSMNQNTNSGISSGLFSVPSTHKTAFSSRYPNASDVQWSKYSSTGVPVDWDLTGRGKLDNDDYVVRYNIGNDSYYSWYDSEGTWVGSSMMMKDYANLPAPVNKIISSNYKGYTVSSANMEYWKDRSAYEIELKGSGDKVKLLVDANGNILQQKKKPL